MLEVFLVYVDGGKGVTAEGMPEVSNLARLVNGILET